MIGMIWFASLAGAFRQGRDLPMSEIAQAPFPESSSLIFMAFPFLFFLPAAFFQRHKQLSIPLVTRAVDSKFGSGAYSRFVTRLKPVALFMSACFMNGLTGLVSTHIENQSSGAYTVSGTFISAGLGLLLAYILSMKFPPRLT